MQDVLLKDPMELQLVDSAPKIVKALLRSQLGVQQDRLPKVLMRLLLDVAQVKQTSTPILLSLMRQVWLSIQMEHQGFM